MREMISLFAVGNPVLSDTLWEDWYRFCLQQEQKYGFVFSHVSCRTESLHPNGIRTRSRYLKKMETAINRKENIFSMEFYLLPNGQVFNYNVNCILNPVDGREARHIIRKIYAE